MAPVATMNGTFKCPELADITEKRGTTVVSIAEAVKIKNCRKNPFVLSLVSAGLLASFAVQARDVQLERMVVTASGFEQNVEDAPASISVLTREELDKQSYTSVVDAVKNIPGVYVTGGGQSQDISIRGMSSLYTLFLVDGRPVSAGRSVNTNGQDSGKQIALPPLSMIERVEVIRGPMSSLYGSEAMGGVVNIITRKPTQEWQGSISAEYTLSNNDISNDAHHMEAVLAGPLIKDLLALRLSGSVTGTDESDYMGGEKTEQSRPETKERQIGAEFILTPDADNRFTLGHTYATQETTTTPGKSVEFTTDGLPSVYRFDKKVYLLSHDGHYGDLTVNTYLQHDISDKVQAADKDEKVTALNSQATYVWGDHIVTFGGRYKKEKYVNEENGLLGQDGAADIEGAVRSASRWIAALYGEIEWGLTEDLAVTTGLRYDDDELFGSHVSPRIYGIYHLAENWTWKGGISTGYRQPSLTQATPGFGTRTGGPGSINKDSAGNSIPRALIIGNKNLSPEKSINYETGFVFNQPSMGVEASLMVFHTDFKDKIAEDRYCESPAAAPLPGNAARSDDVANYACEFGGNKYYYLSTNKNISKAMMRGIELAGSYQISPALRASGSYTYTKSEQKSGEFSGKPLNKQPKSMLNAMLDWQVNGQLNAWLQGNYRGKTSDFLSRTTMDSGTPGYGTVDVGMVYQLNKVARLKAGIYNLGNKKITNDSYGVVLDGRRLTMGISADF